MVEKLKEKEPTLQTYADEARRMLKQYAGALPLIVDVCSRTEKDANGNPKVLQRMVCLQVDEKVYDLGSRKWLSLDKFRTKETDVHKGYFYDFAGVVKDANVASKALMSFTVKELEAVAHWKPPLKDLIYGHVNAAEKAAGTMNVETGAGVARAVMHKTAEEVGKKVKVGSVGIIYPGIPDSFRGMEPRKLVLGLSGKDVDWVQAKLEAMGYSTGKSANVDGKEYGEATADAVKRLQKEWGLRETGTFGKQELDALLAKMRGEEPASYKPKAGQPYAKGDAVKVESDLEAVAKKFHAEYQDRINHGWRGREESGYGFGVDKQ
ncbi:MAG: peptidoglycan-binding domain-containing protein, partial [Candidatus Micrarchaeia archaeon]